MSDTPECYPLTATEAVPTERQDLRRAVARFATPTWAASVWQFASSLSLFVVACVAMHWAYSRAYC